MPVTLANMAAKEANLTITGGPLGEDTISLVYYPNRLTGNAVNALYNANGLDTLTQTLSEVIKSWDVLETEDGPAVAITPENLARLGFPFLMQLGMKIAEDIRPN